MENRFLLQAQSWITSVNCAREYGSLLEDDYREIRYEDLCRDPAQEMRRLSDWMILPLEPHLAFEFPKVSTKQLGKWRRTPLSNAERRDFQRAVELARPLLTELGYMDG